MDSSAPELLSELHRRMADLERRLVTLEQRRQQLLHLRREVSVVKRACHLLLQALQESRDFQLALDRRLRALET